MVSNASNGRRLWSQVNGKSRKPGNEAACNEQLEKRACNLEKASRADPRGII